MNPQRWQRLRDLFERALDKDPSEVRAFVNAEAADDSELRDEVLSLLNSHERAALFLTQPLDVPVAALCSGDDLPESDPALPPGQTIGPGTIVR